MRYPALLIAMMLCLAAGPATQRAGESLKSDAPADVKKWWDSLPELRKAAKPRFTRRVTEAKAALSKIRGQKFETRREKEEAVQWAKNAVAAAESNLKNLNFAILYDPQAEIEVGSIFEVDELGVLEVVSEKEVIANYKRRDIWVSGIDASKAVDEKMLDLGRPTAFRIEGTKQFSTAIGGRRTVLLATPFDYRKYLTD